MFILGDNLFGKCDNTGGFFFREKLPGRTGPGHTGWHKQNTSKSCHTCSQEGSSIYMHGLVLIRLDNFVINPFRTKLN
jgi:hypothetical protein